MIFQINGGSLPPVSTPSGSAHGSKVLTSDVNSNDFSAKLQVLLKLHFLSIYASISIKVTTNMLSLIRKTLKNTDNIIKNAKVRVGCWENV